MKKSIKIYFQVIALALVVFTIHSCENPFSKNIREGIVYYSISYPSIPEDNVMLDLMPKKMEMAFKDNNYKSDIIAGMGLFKTSIICDPKEEKLTHTFKMLNNKFACTLDPSDIQKISPDLIDISIRETGKTKQIAGFNCKEVIVFKDDEEKFKIYYTEEIKIKDPNKSTPFQDIPGVLMEYEIINYDTHMHFVVNEVVEKEVKKADLVLEDGYKMISSELLRQKMESIFDKVR